MLISHSCALTEDCPWSQEPYSSGAAHRQGQFDTEKWGPPSISQIVATIKLLPNPKFCISTTKFSVATVVKVNFCCPIQSASLPYSCISQDHSLMKLPYIKSSYFRICFQKIQSKTSIIEFSRRYLENKKIRERNTLHRGILL